MNWKVKLLQPGSPSEFENTNLGLWGYPFEIQKKPLSTFHLMKISKAVHIRGYPFRSQ
jgi:hypothetical protein